MKCALLDENNVFLGMADVAEPGPRHLPQITRCDLPPGEYAWEPDDSNPYGGAFVPLPLRLRRLARETYAAVAAMKGGAA